MKIAITVIYMIEVSMNIKSLKSENGAFKIVRNRVSTSVIGYFDVSNSSFSHEVANKGIYKMAYYTKLTCSVFAFL